MNVNRKFTLNDTHQEVVKASIRSVENHPVKGVEFKDVSHIFWNPDSRFMVNRYMLRAAQAMIAPNTAIRVLSIETRGHWFSGALADALDAPLTFIRKADKAVPGTYGSIVESTSEYGSTKFAIPHIQPCNNLTAVLVDDVLATGGTAFAIASELKTRYAGYAGFNVCLVTMAEISALGGRDRLATIGCQAESVVQY